MLVTVVWLEQFVGALTVELVFFPSAGTGFLEPIPNGGMLTEVLFHQVPQSLSPKEIHRGLYKL